MNKNTEKQYLPDFKDNLQLLAVVLSLAFIAQIWVSYGLWLPLGRLYPMISPIEALPLQFGDTLNLLLFVLFIGALLLTAFAHLKHISIPILAVIFIFWLLQDIMRLQAWSYHYMMMLLLLYLATIFPSKRAEVLWLLRFVMIATYIWTGIHKVNIHFSESVFPWLMKIFDLTAPLAKIKVLGYALAIFEALLGLGLIWKQTRRITLWTLTGFHAVILILLIKDGWNYVVYTWNVAMVCILWILFAKVPEEKTRSFSWPLAYPFLFLFGLAPGLQPLGLWPHDMSLMMYTGLSEDMRLYLSEEAAKKEEIWQCMPKAIVGEIVDEEDGTFSLNLDDWSMLTLNVPTYPGEWYYRRVAAKLCPCLRDAAAFIHVEQPLRWTMKDHIIEIHCKDFNK